MVTSEVIIAIAVGIGLAASCGFRIFVPLLVMNLAARAGQLDLASGFEWMGGSIALVAFATATILEILAYYIPWFDNLLDTVATPAAVLAGVLVSASVVGDVSPFLKWGLAVIAGGGTAAAVQGGTVLLRATSSVSTGGSGNPFVATGELLASILTSVLAIIAPIVCLVLVLFALGLILRRYAFAPTPRPPSD